MPAGPVQDVAIRPGMSEAVDPTQLPLGTPRLLQNVRTRRGGRIEKRPGTEALVTSNLPTAGYGGFAIEHKGLATVGVESTVNSSRARHIYQLSHSGTYWTRLGRHGVIVPERRFGISLDDNGAGREHTCAALDGTVFIAHADTSSGTTTTILAVDPAGAVLRRASIANAARPRLLNVDGTLYVVYRLTTGAGTTLEVRTVTPTTLQVGSATSVGTLSASTRVYDAAPVEGASTWVLAYPNSSTSLTVKVMSGTSASVSTTVATNTTASCIGVAAYAGEYVCVVYNDVATAEAWLGSVAALSGGGNYTIHTPSGSEAYGAAQFGVVRTAANTFAFVVSGTDSTSSPTLETAFIAHGTVTSAGTVTGPSKVYHYTPASKPFTYGPAGERQVLIWAHNQNDDTFWLDQARHFVLELQESTVSGSGANIAAISYEHLATYGALAARRDHIPEVADLGSGRRAVQLLWDDPGEIEGIDLAVFRCSLASDSATAAARHVVSSGGALHVSGGCLYDVSEGTTLPAEYYLPENGFPYAPEVVLTTAAGGLLTADQQYTIVAVYAWLDSAGRVHRSAPSKPKTATPTGANLTISGRVSTCSATGRLGSIAGQPVIELYSSWNGGPYYFVASAGAATPSALSVSFTYASADSTLEDNPVLYTDLGIIPTEPPSGARLVCVSGVRMFTVGWQANVVQASKLYLASAPWEFTDDDAFRIPVPEEITALAHMDGALVVFSARSVFVVTGDGPNDQGVGSFSDPRRLPAMVGADSPHVVETSQGLMFKGAGTIWLLPRGFGPPVPVGEDIQETLSDYPVLRGAYLCANADDDCTHFVLAGSDSYSASTVVAVYDNRLGTWSRDTITGEVGAAGVVDGEFTWLLPSWDTASTQYPARQFSTASYQDLSSTGTATWIESRVGFGDWRPFGALGRGSFDKLALLGAVAGAHTLKLDVSVDGAAAYTATLDLTTVSSSEYLSHQLRTQRGTSWRFDVYDAEASGQGKTAGMVLHAVAFEAQPEPGPRRVPEGKRL